jgi:HPt (histidine-containing phosphotransfer) domain-containing protein
VPSVWRNILVGFLSTKNLSLSTAVESIQSDFHADREFLSLIRMFVSKLPSQLAEMRAALQVADLARLTRLAHALADGGKLYGYPTLFDAAQRLEKLILAGRDSSEQSELLDQLDKIIAKVEAGMKHSRSSGYLALPGLLTKAA